MLHLIFSLCFSGSRSNAANSASSEEVLRNVNQLLIASSRSRELLDRFWKELVRIDGDISNDIFEQLDSARAIVQQVDSKLSAIELALSSKRGGGLEKASSVLGEQFSTANISPNARACAGIPEGAKSLSQEQSITALEKILISVHFHIQSCTPNKRALRGSIAA